MVTIKDNGPGISPENLKAVFYDGWQFKANMLQVRQFSWVISLVMIAEHPATLEVCRAVVLIGILFYRVEKGPA